MLRKLGILMDKTVNFLSRLSQKQEIFLKALLNKSCSEEYFYSVPLGYHLKSSSAPKNFFSKYPKTLKNF